MLTIVQHINIFQGSFPDFSWQKTLSKTLPKIIAAIIVNNVSTYIIKYQTEEGVEKYFLKVISIV